MARWLMTERSHKMLFSASGIVLSWVYEKVAMLRGYALDAKDWKNIEQGVTTMIDRLVVDLTAIVKTPIHMMYVLVQKNLDYLFHWTWFYLWTLKFYITINSKNFKWYVVADVSSARVSSLKVLAFSLRMVLMRCIIHAYLVAYISTT